jgi:transposase
MNLILDTVISHITGVTGLRIIQAILNGERSPEVLAQYRDCRIKATEDDIAKSLEGTYRTEHLFVLRQAYTAYQFVQQQIAACDQAVESLLKTVDKAVDVTQHPLPASTRSPRKPQGNDPTYDARSYVYEIYGVDLTQIPGFQASTAQTLLSEVGRDMTKWKTAKHFTSWLGLSPNAKRSGGKDASMKTRKVQSRAALAFRHAARAVTQSHSSLGAFYRRLRARCGPSKALTATARKLAVIFYHMVKDGKEYQELGKDYYLKQQKTRQVRKLKTQARLLGFELTPSSLSQQPEAGSKENTP